ncbi:MAG: hypothetical protein ACREJM_09935 [Candidatus Saccharimonadales bacterium]
MSEFEYESRPAGREGLKEFLDKLRATDEDIVPDMAVAGHDALIDHQKMKGAVYWLLSNDACPQPYADREIFYEDQVRRLAGRLEIGGDPKRIKDVIERYEDRVFVEGERRGEA